MKKSNLLNSTKLMNCGMKCTVIKDNGYNDITVKFEDGTIVEHTQRSSFKNCCIANPSLGRSFTKSLNTSILGKIKMMNNGMKCCVIEDKGSSNITVKFEDGFIKKSNRNDFKRGCIKNDNYLKGNLLGQCAEMNCGMKCSVIEDKGSLNITVKFEDGTIVSKQRRDYFKKKTIANPNLGTRFSVKKKTSIKGRKKIMKSGLLCEVLEDNGYHDIIVKFEDGSLKRTTRDRFLDGSVFNPNLGRGYAYSLKNSILGQTKLMRCGMKCTVIEDNGGDDISVEFEDGTQVVHKTRYSFKHRTIINPKLMNMSSMPQKLLYYFINKYFPDTIQNFRPDWLKNEITNSNMEIDIWIPSLRFGIEYDGVVWHREENLRSESKFTLIKKSNEIKKLITVLEKGAIIHESDKHYNIVLNATSNRKETKEFINEMEKAINEILNIIGINEKIEITEELIEKLYSSDIVRISSPNLIRGENDLETLRPDLAIEWDYEKNKFLPSDVTKGSGKEVWWICSKCSYSWSARILNRARINGTGCPKCHPRSSIKKVINIETKTIYNSISEASRLLGIKKDLIAGCCKKTIDSAGGYHWKYLDE